MNHEVTSTLWPLSGDVSSEAGSTIVTVTGINNRPVQDTVLQGGEAIVYDSNVGQWTPRLQASIQVNNVTVSDDALIAVNVVKPILINGA